MARQIDDAKVAESRVQVDDAKVAESRAQMVERLRAAREPWLSEKQIRAGRRGAAHNAAFEQLLAERRLVELGRRQGFKVYSLVAEGQTPKAKAIALAERHLDAVEEQRTALRNRLKPVPMREVRKDTAPKHLPTGVRAVLLDVLKTRMDAARAFPIKVGSVDCFLFASDLRAMLDGHQSGQEGAPEPPQAAVPSEPAEPSPSDPAASASSDSTASSPSDPAASSQTEARVREAYRALREQTGLRNVHISEIERRSGVGREALHAFLNQERKARRANATLGEPTAATPEQLAAALTIDGLPHIYVELYE